MSSESDNSQTKSKGTDWQSYFSINEFSRYADAHHREIKYGIYIAGAAGAFLIVRSLRLFTKFGAVEKIPDSFFRKQIKLNGFVRSIEGGEKATLNIEHLPIVEMGYHKRMRDLLPVRLAGLGKWSEPAASKFVAEKVLNRRVTFQLVEAGPKEAYLVAAVYYKPFHLRSYSLNADIVAHGLAPYVFQGSPEAAKTKGGLLQLQPLEHKLSERLMDAQLYAQKKKVGIWHDVKAAKEEAEKKKQSFVTALVPKRVTGSFQTVRSATAALSRGIRYVVSAVIYFPSFVKDKILQRRSIS